MGELRARAREALLVCDPSRKIALVSACAQLLDAGTLVINPESRLACAEIPGRPGAPRLVAPRDVPRRRLRSATGHAALIHAVAHIEFNAINLALDACARFSDMPDDYYTDWFRVAREEAHHFTLLSQHLVALGSHYGAFDAHDGLWLAAQRTKDDVLARMALVPRILEARGLDVTPGMQERLRSIGDHEGVAILDIILRDEIGHVAVANRWFHGLCEARGVAPQATFDALCAAYAVTPPHAPFNVAARLAAGFTQMELDAFEARHAEWRQAT